ncbi:MAG: hypothetical protein ABWK01_05680 [Infirmifilum sp.]
MNVETFYNIVKCPGGICIEFDCSVRGFVADVLQLEALEGGEVCFSQTSFNNFDDAVAFLVSRGVSKSRIAVEGSPIAIEFSSSWRQNRLICPVCGSIRIMRVGVIGLTPTLYVCENCGYRGALVLEVEG